MAKRSVHVLCEKPMAVTAEDCERMVGACRENQVKLMIAYRLHFEEINLQVIELVRRGRIGEPKFFNSSFSLAVRPGNIRTKKDLGGGTTLIARHDMPRVSRVRDRQRISFRRSAGLARIARAPFSTIGR